MNPGSLGYFLGISLACGATAMSPANNVWQNGNFNGAVGQGNFLANATGSQLDLFFLQHEPGVCSQLMDLDFDTNLLRSQRYFQKSYQQSDKPGTATQTSDIVLIAPVAGAAQSIFIPFKRTMAKAPTMTIYSPATGAANNIRDYSAGTDRVVNAVYSPSDSGYGGVALATGPTVSANLQWHHVADTGW